VANFLQKSGYTSAEPGLAAPDLKANPQEGALRVNYQHNAGTRAYGKNNAGKQGKERVFFFVNKKEAKKTFGI
jgi:hypothetical protein